MSQGDNRASGGLMSSAGLTTFYDSETEHIAISPRTVSLLVLAIAVLVSTMNIIII